MLLLLPDCTGLCLRGKLDRPVVLLLPLTLILKLSVLHCMLPPPLHTHTHRGVGVATAPGLYLPQKLDMLLDYLLVSPLETMGQQLSSIFSSSSSSSSSNSSSNNSGNSGKALAARVAQQQQAGHTLRRSSSVTTSSSSDAVTSSSGSSVTNSSSRVSRSTSSSSSVTSSIDDARVLAGSGDLDHPATRVVVRRSLRSLMPGPREVLKRFWEPLVLQVGVCYVCLCVCLAVGWGEGGLDPAQGLGGGGVRGDTSMPSGRAITVTPLGSALLDCVRTKYSRTQVTCYTSCSPQNSVTVSQEPTYRSGVVVCRTAPLEPAPTPTGAANILESVLGVTHYQQLPRTGTNPPMLTLPGFLLPQAHFLFVPLLPPPPACRSPRTALWWWCTAQHHLNPHPHPPVQQTS